MKKKEISPQKRRHRISWKPLVFQMLYVMAIVFNVSSVSSTFADSNGERPNVLFIAVDDLRPELNCYGTGDQPKKAITPNLDELAASGVRFSKAYCNQAVCGASRVSLMTGLYPEFTKERTYHVKDWRKRWSNVVTLNQHFKNSGYTTVGLGKIYHNTAGPAVDVKNWTQWINVSTQQYANAESRNQMRESKNPLPGAKATWSNGPSTEAADDPNFVYVDGLRAHRAVRQIEKLSQESDPFFLAVGFTKPHLP
ncbi:MAG: sulfatase-like hydrolase/transferase, partial [Planctomycetota bacterium]